MKLNGITIKQKIGVGDALQFSSLPENYFKATGRKLVDLSRPWFFDHNPYVDRETPAESCKKIIEMWNYGPTQYQFPVLRPEKIYLSNAEIHAGVWNCPVSLNRPRLYLHEDFPFEKRESIFVHIQGKSHGEMPDHVIDHILKKYGPTKRLYQIGLSTDRDIGIPRIETKTLWELAAVLSTGRMFIGMDSGPSWVAACYPDVVAKKIRLKPSPEFLTTWVPLEVQNIHSHWDDRLFQIHNPTENDIGFTYSYRRL